MISAGRTPNPPSRRVQLIGFGVWVFGVGAGVLVGSYYIGNEKSLYLRLSGVVVAGYLGWLVANGTTIMFARARRSWRNA